MNVTIVIDCGWGDGGKGLTVDWKASLADPDRTRVLRYGSSAQCGHTVVTPEGKRHSHGHLPSGSLQSVSGMFGPKFIMPSGRSRLLDMGHLARLFESALPLKNIYTSRGPIRETVITYPSR